MGPEKPARRGHRRTAQRTLANTDICRPPLRPSWRVKRSEGRAIRVCLPNRLQPNLGAWMTSPQSCSPRPHTDGVAT